MYVMLEDKLFDPPQVTGAHPAITGQRNTGPSQNLHSPSGVRTWMCTGSCPSSEQKWNRNDPTRRTVGMLNPYHAYGIARGISD